MEKHECEERVYPPGNAFHHYQCGKNAKSYENGKWYCGIHNAEAVANRKAKSDAKYAEYSRNLDEKNRKHKEMQKLLKAAEKWMDAQTMHHTTDLYNACTTYFERKIVIPD